MDSAFVYSIASSMDARTKTGFRRLARRLTSNQQDFGGIVLDSACTGASVISATEYERYCRDTGGEYLIDADSRGHVKFGNAKQGRNVGRLQSLGVARIRGYVDTFDEVFEFDAHVIPGTDTPLLISIQDLDSLSYDLRTRTRSLWSHDRDRPKCGEYPIGPHPLHVDGHGRCVIRWDYAAEALFTEAEQRNFHRSYGHRSAETIIKSLEEAGFEDLPADTKDKLNDIARACDPCQRNAVKLLYFSISVKWKDQRFNHLVLADVVRFCDGDLVHVIDRATRLNGVRFTPSLKNPSAPEIWNAIKLCWIDIYLGPPDILQVDQGRNFNASFIQTACAINGIEFQSIPTEAPWRMGVVERAHVPLELAYNKRRAELPELDSELLLSMAVKCVNDAVGPSGVSPTYAVFGSGARHFPALSKQYAATHAERIHAMETARKQIEKHHAKASVEAARTHHGPGPGEQQLAVGDAVLTYRKDVGWIGPYKVTRLTDADVEVRMPNHDRTNLERSQVRIYTPPVPDEEVSLDMYRRGAMVGTPDITVPDTSAENDIYEEFRNAEYIVDAAESSVFALNVDSDIIVGQSGDEFSDLFALATKVLEQSPQNAERFSAS
jgi:hypothetical protein